MTYKPPPQPQMDGTRYASYNCVPAVCVMLVDRHTLGAKRTTASRIRSYSGVTALRGLTYGEAAYGTQRATGVVIEPRYGQSRYAVKVLGQDRGQGVSIHTAVTRYTPVRTNYFIGGHTVYVNHYYYGPCRCYMKVAGNHAEYAVEDPGTSSASYLYWPADLLYRAAEYRTNGAGINVLVGRDTEGVGRPAILNAAIHAKPLKTSTKLGTVKAGTSVRVNRTVNGGIWARDSGGYSTGWHRIDRGDKADGFVIGKRLR